ncbi:MAG: sugar phosphate isomerase/epimerase, partial [Candidatus Atribacteria bacterium]|nr:sugar phosphate isomerase/epimerase [Candidatus Atribacteria bacterium]
VNTAEQATYLMEMIGEPNVKAHLDTYHMNIEEKDFYSPILRLGEHLGYIHLCENDRGIPGTGLVRWNDVFRGLRDIGFQGNVAIESFVASVPRIAAATCVWRSLAPDGDTLARKGLKFLKGIAQQHS